MPDTHALAERPSGSQGQGQLAVYDAIVIGAGISGMYMLYRLRELGMTTRVFESGTDVGGTWYWNRYPGARFDSESWTYGYSFSKELMQEWDWKEHFSPQPDTLEYLNYVAQKFDLRRDMRFRSTVVAAHWDEAANRWNVTLESGQRANSRFLFTAIGILSAYTLPAIPGRDSFRGPAYHPARWPHTPVDFTGKRVGIVGTGATAIQAIPEIAKQAKHLTVFQRRPNWAAPLHNSKISKEEMAEIKSRYEEIYAHCATTPSWFIHQADPRKTLDVPPEEREAFWEKKYGEPGFGIWMGNFRDILTNEAANAAISAFIAKKIRQRVKDPKVADKLMVLGPHTARGNIPQAISHSVEFQAGLLRFMQQHNYTRVATRSEQVDEWTQIVIKAGEALLSFKIDSWQNGVNRNVEGRTVRRVLGYNGNGAHFRRTTDEVAKGGYQEFAFR